MRHLDPVILEVGVKDQGSPQEPRSVILPQRGTAIAEDNGWNLVLGGDDDVHVRTDFNSAPDGHRAEAAQNHDQVRVLAKERNLALKCDEGIIHGHRGQGVRLAKAGSRARRGLEDAENADPEASTMDDPRTRDAETRLKREIASHIGHANGPHRPTKVLDSLNQLRHAHRCRVVMHSLHLFEIERFLLAGEEVGRVTRAYIHERVSRVEE